MCVCVCGVCACVCTKLDASLSCVYHFCVCITYVCVVTLMALVIVFTVSLVTGVTINLHLSRIKRVGVRCNSVMVSTCCCACCVQVGLARTIYKHVQGWPEPYIHIYGTYIYTVYICVCVVYERCMYCILGMEITKFANLRSCTVSVYIQFWPTLRAGGVAATSLQD